MKNTVPNQQHNNTIIKNLAKRPEFKLKTASPQNLGYSLSICSRDTGPSRPLFLGQRHNVSLNDIQLPEPLKKTYGSSSLTFVNMINSELKTTLEDNNFSYLSSSFPAQFQPLIVMLPSENNATPNSVIPESAEFIPRYNHSTQDKADCLIAISYSLDGNVLKKDIHMLSRFPEKKSCNNSDSTMRTAFKAALIQHSDYEALKKNGFMVTFVRLEQRINIQTSLDLDSADYDTCDCMKGAVVCYCKTATIKNEPFNILSVDVYYVGVMVLSTNTHLFNENKCVEVMQSHINALNMTPLHKLKSSYFQQDFNDDINHYVFNKYHIPAAAYDSSKLVIHALYACAGVTNNDDEDFNTPNELIIAPRYMVPAHVDKFKNTALIPIFGNAGIQSSSFSLSTEWHKNTYSHVFTYPFTLIKSRFSEIQQCIDLFLSNPRHFEATLRHMALHNHHHKRYFSELRVIWQKILDPMSICIDITDCVEIILFNMFNDNDEDESISIPQKMSAGNQGMIESILDVHFRLGLTYEHAKQWTAAFNQEFVTKNERLPLDSETAQLLTDSEDVYQTISIPGKILSSDACIELFKSTLNKLYNKQSDLVFSWAEKTALNRNEIYRNNVLLDKMLFFKTNKLLPLHEESNQDIEKIDNSDCDGLDLY